MTTLPAVKSAWSIATDRGRGAPQKRRELEKKRKTKKGNLEEEGERILLRGGAGRECKSTPARLCAF